jgi:CRISPR/Cas system-associated exonuclease Cas4 (RecB family)
MAFAIRSASASIRLHEARKFLDTFSPGTEVLLLGASRGAVDDLARTIAMEKGATFGLHRLSFTQLAARLAAAELASNGHAPSSALGYEAVAARAAFEANKDEALDYFSPVSSTPGFPKALARTLQELRLAGVAAGPLAGLLRSGPDLADLLDRVETLMSEAGASDRASLFATAAKALKSADTAWPSTPVLLLDVPFESDAEAEFLWTLVKGSPNALVTVPDGDMRTIAQLEKRGVELQRREPDGDTDLTRLARHLFSAEPPPERERSGELVWFSGPGEGRECVEIARRILKEAGSVCGRSEAQSRRATASGGGAPRAVNDVIRFDEIAILIRSPQHYVGVLEHALARAKIPAYFDRGIRRPHPAGRAFLAMLSCAAEDFSAKRFAEYLSLAQVPSLSPETGAKRDDVWVASTDEVFGVLSEKTAQTTDEVVQDQSPVPNPESLDSADSASAVVSGSLRAPWKWESLLVESAVIGGSQRWARRLNGLAEQYRLQIRELTEEEPDSSRIPHFERELQNLEHLRAFALPLVETISEWPDQATWGDWLQRLEGFAPRILRKPEHVLRVLADLRPMAAVGPVSLVEVRDVLAARLLSLEVEPPANRYGRVFVGSPHQARGRVFKVVFAPGLAERMFPQKLREDPLLLDDLRQDLNKDRSLKGLPAVALAKVGDRAEVERLLLRLAIGAATDRLYASFPRIESSEARARVPSFYALEIMRAVTGRVPDYQKLELTAAEEAKASLAWPAPADAADAIDDFEHDLAVLRRLMFSGDDVKGHAHYMLTLNACLKRSVTERWARARKDWSQYDGLVRVTDATRPFLQKQRLNARPYSVSALQQFSACPYRFFLSAAYRLSPLEEPEPLQRMDPLTKGSLFHQVQAEFFRALQKANLSIVTGKRQRVLKTLDATLERIAAEYYELLAPAIDRVWQDEIASMRTDLRVWVDQLATNAEWEPWLFEFAFGLPGQPGHDPASLKDPVTINGRFILRGSVDLVERKPGTKILRVTDHKTGKNRSSKGAFIGGGAQLQPIIYSLAVEEATGNTVESGRFSYCTTAGGFTDHAVPINERTRRMGIEVLEIIDRAVELGMLPPAPADRACGMCDFLTVCGPDRERAARKKAPNQIADLLDLRERP